jgi:hypothetical protein
MLPKEPPNIEVNEPVPKNTKGRAHNKTINISLGPVRKFLSDSIMAIL